ncbi:MAG: hypothetical protein J6Y01_03605, partial [Spirochaetales bacterium]|nr:hypothetical protein [Spirochaetales bacterium]
AQMNDITGKMNEMRNTLDGSITEYINNSEAELNAAFQQRLNDFAAETDRIQNEAAADIQSFETELERFKTQLANFDKHYSEQVAQKFSETDSTLETKLNEMQSVFSGQIAGIKANYQIQTQQLTEEKNQQLGLFREEFDNLINEKNSQLESFKAEFDSLNNDISLIKSRLDSEINSQIDRGNGLLAEAFEAGNAMIEANYAKLHEETERYVNTHKNELLNIRQKTADLESQINNNLRSRFENVDLRLDDQFGKWNNEYNNFIEELKNGIGNTEKDFRDRLTALQTSYIERNDQIVNRNFDRFNELREKLDSISEDMNGINSRFDFYLNQKVEEVNTNFTEKLDAADRNVSQRLTELDNNITVRLENLDNNVSTKLVGWDNNVNDKLSSIDGQITQYVASFKDNVDARFVTIDNDINDKVNQAYSKLDSQVAAIHNEVISKVESINESCKQSTNAMMEENQKHFFESESRIKNIVQNIETYRMQTGNRLNTITNEYIEKIKSAQTDVNSINDKIAHINEIIDNDFQKSYEQNKIDMQLMLDAHKNELESQYRQISDDTMSQINDCREELRRMNDEFTESFNSTKDTLDEIISNAQESFTDKQNTLNNEILSKINEYRNEFENVKTDMTVVLSSTKDELRNLIASGKNELSEEYQKLQDETAAHISEFRQELMSVRSGISDADSKLAEYISNKSNEIDKQASATFAEINRTYMEQISELDTRLSSMESNYSDKYKDLSNIYDGMKSELENIRWTVNAQIKADADTQLMTTKEQITDLFNHEMNILNGKVRNLDETTQIKMDDFKKEIMRIQTNLKQLDDNFSAKYMDHSNILDKRIDMIESEIRDFEKNTAVYERANSLKEKLNSDITDLKNTLSSIRADKNDLNDLQKKLLAIGSQYSAAEEKFSRIQNEKKNIDKMSDTLTELKEFTDTVKDKIDNMENIRLSIKNIDDRLDDANVKFNSVAQYMEEIAAKEIGLQDCISNIEKMGSQAGQLENKLLLLDKKFADLELKKDTYDEKIRNFEQKAGIITKSSDKVNEVVEMYHNLDTLVKALEERTDNVQKMRKWLVTAETNLENLTHDADQKIKLFDALSDKVQNEFTDDILQDEDKKHDSIMRLMDQGWSVDEIAHSLSLSVGEVEMIADLNYVKR